MGLRSDLRSCLKLTRSSRVAENTAMGMFTSPKLIMPFQIARIDVPGLIQGADCSKSSNSPPITRPPSPLAVGRRVPTEKERPDRPQPKPAGRLTAFLRSLIPTPQRLL